jgi:hypothetical protein
MTLYLLVFVSSCLFHGMSAFYGLLFENAMDLRKWAFCPDITLHY